MHVHIADDHGLLRQGLTELLKNHDPSWTFSESGTFDDTVATISADMPDLLIIDLRMPGMQGQESLRAIREALPELKVVVLTGLDDKNTILECLAAGVHGYVTKSSASEQILTAIKTVLSGGVYAPAALASVHRAAEAELPRQSGSHSTSGGTTPGNSRTSWRDATRSSKLPRRICAATVLSASWLLRLISSTCSRAITELVRSLMSKVVVAVYCFGDLSR